MRISIVLQLVYYASRVLCKERPITVFYYALLLWSMPEIVPLHTAPPRLLRKLAFVDVARHRLVTSIVIQTAGSLSHGNSEISLSAADLA